MNFADQYKSSQAEERLMKLEREEGPLIEFEFDMDGPGFSDENTVTISEKRFMDLAEDVSFGMIKEIKQRAQEEDMDDTHMIVATMMTNILLIEDIRRALFGDKDVPEKK